MAEEKPKRVFLAIDLPEEVKHHLMTIQGKLKLLVEGVRWTRAEGIHLTLKFFGNIFDNDIAVITDVVTRHAKRADPMVLGVDRVGAFPKLEKPRVVWLGVNGEVDKLSTLQKTIDDDLERCGFRKEGRTFRPHLTLGRAKSTRGTIRGMPEAATRLDSPGGKRFTAKGLTLFQSDLTPGGAVYTELAYFPFAGDE